MDTFIQERIDPQLRDYILAEGGSLQRIKLNQRQLCDLELILNGGFYPLNGFLVEEDYESVLKDMRLNDGNLWPIPITLDVPESIVPSLGDRVILCNQEGKPLALMDVESVYQPDFEKEADLVFGTTDPVHHGVSQLSDQHPTYIGGPVNGIELPYYADFPELRHTPQVLREQLKQRGWDKVIGFQTRNPMHRAHYEIVKEAAEEHNAKVLIHPVVGLTKTGDVDYVTRVRSYQALYNHYAKDFAIVSLLPLAMRMAGPREALWHAIIRKNYGCTHFIVGRDHAGPGKNSLGEPFYDPYAAQELVTKHEDELGIKLVTPKEFVYVDQEKKYLPIDKVETHHTTQSISGTELREMLNTGKVIPEWFSFPEVVQELQKKNNDRQPGLCLFFTGLSGAGKSTVAHAVIQRLQEEYQLAVTLLDGDIVRENLSKGLGFSKEDRDTNILRIGFVAAEIVRHGGVVVCAAIAPYEETRQKNRTKINKNGNYIEIFLATPIEVCKQRDTKGLYAKAEQGLIKNFTGVDDPYESPSQAEIVIDTSDCSPQESVQVIMDYLLNNRLLSNDK